MQRLTLSEANTPVKQLKWHDTTEVEMAYN